MKKVKVCVTGAAGNIAYALVFRLCDGSTFGDDVLIDLNLLDIPTKRINLEGLAMELNDTFLPLLNRVVVTTNPNEAFYDADWALLVGAYPRGQGMLRRELIGLNASIFVEQAKILDKIAKKDCRTVVVGNPCNTNAYIVKEMFQNLDPRNVFAMTYLDENRAKYQIAKKMNGRIENVSNLAIWGNHSKTMYPNFYEGKIGDKKIIDICDKAWLKNEFLETIQDRGSEIIKKRGLSSAASAASSLLDTIKSLINPTKEGNYFSVGVLSDGSYGIQEGLIFSYPIVSDGKDWKIVQGIELNEFSKKKIKETEDELKSELSDAIEMMRED